MKYISRIHQFFPKELMIKLNNICNDVLISDNNTKVDKMVQLLDEYGLPYSELGPGTNRFAIMIDGYVFKIAMDRDGVRDNLAEFSMSIELQPFVTKIYECNGLIIVAEYVTVISKDEFQRSKEELQQILVHLSQGYLLGDVGTISKNFMNWGYRPDGSLVILDFAYIYRVIGEEMLCDNILDDNNKCGAMLEYDENYHKLVCPRCRRKYIFHEIRRRINKDYEKRELETIKKIAIKLTEPTLDVKDVTKLHEIQNSNEGDKDMKQRDFYNNDAITEEEALDSYQEAMEAILNMKKGSNKACEKNTPDIGVPHFTPKPYIDDEELVEEDDPDDYETIGDFLDELSVREDECDDDSEDDDEEEYYDESSYAVVDPDADDDECEPESIPAVVEPSMVSGNIEVSVNEDEHLKTLVVTDTFESDSESDEEEYYDPDKDEAEYYAEETEECVDAVEEPIEEVSEEEVEIFAETIEEETEEISEDEAEDLREEVMDELSEAMEDSEVGSVITYEPDEEITEECEPEPQHNQFKPDDVMILSETSEDNIRNMRNELMSSISVESSDVDEDDEYDELYEENFRTNQRIKQNQRIKRDKGV